VKLNGILERKFLFRNLKAIHSRNLMLLTLTQQNPWLKRAPHCSRNLMLLTLTQQNPWLKRAPHCSRNPMLLTLTQ
jgi:1,2-phenylacetyl-CoA epoxidase catalytic subunit